MRQNMHGSVMDDYLDPLGQLPLIKIYTQICLCFSVADASSHSAIINMLTDGLERLSASFPWIAGKLVNEGSGEGNSGIFKIKAMEKIPRLVVKDLRHDPSIPTMDALRRANFPFSMLDETIIAPCKTLPGSSDESASDSMPVFLLQANFVTGGLVLTFVGQHNTMDMIGQGHIIHLLSKACRNEQFTSEELSSGNLSRRNLIPLLDSYKQGSELVRQIVKPTSSHLISNDANGHSALPPSPKCTWTYFTFHPTSLTALKSLATKSITLPLSYISTDDALSAFIWQSVIRARLPRLNPTAESTFARAVDVRHYLDISQTYPGLMQNMTYHTYTIQELVEEPLGGVASHLRSALDPKTSNLGYQTRALATFLNRTPDKNMISFTATLDLSVDIAFSSWAKVNCYELDFNLGLGKPVAVRRPQFDPVESLIYLMPRTLDGEIAVGICLRDEDMERLRADKEFTKYGRYIG
ncbi:putative trichothecene 3-O-acetyltransferase [Ramaria rubella]|nr:putative trichothecene 3-O-acetyltransferase [Ramaria rubella]